MTKLPKMDVPEPVVNGLLSVNVDVGTGENGANDTPVLGEFWFTTLDFHYSDTLSVNGVLKSFSEVTDEDTELMTPDEYTAYYDILQLQS